MMHRNSIKFKIAFIVTLIILISNITLGIFNYEESKEISTNIIIKKSEDELQNISDYFFDKLTFDMEYIVNYWANSDEIKTYKKKANSKKIVASIPSDFETIYKQWMGLSNSAADITWIYYALESDGSIYIAPIDETMPSDYDARTRKWYQGTVAKSGEIFWTEPYVDAGDSKKILQTVSKAVYHNNQLKGVIGLDIELNKFTEIINNLSMSKNSSIFLINENHQVIAHSDPEIEPHKRQFLDELSPDNISEIRTHSNNQFVISSINLNLNNWKLVAITKTSFSEDLDFMKVRIIIIVLFTIIFSTLFSYFGFKSILVHLKSLVLITQSFSEGNFSMRAKVDSRDEFETLAISMNNMLDHIENLIIRQDSNYLKTVKALANAIEVSDEYTRGHCDRVEYISLSIAESMKLDEKRKIHLKFACILHDIGKIGIPESILNKTTPLSDKEYELIKTHPQIGHDIIKDIEFLSIAREILLQHHERVDGKGYPNKLTSDEILLESKILTVADAYDAISTLRVYRSSTLSAEEIKKELIRCSGIQFDEDIVRCMIELMDKADFLNKLNSI